MPQIHFNGKTYNDIAEMPATERQAYEQLMEIFKDEDQDGTPDFFQGDVIQNILEVAAENAFVDEAQLRKLEQMSPRQRAMISKGFSMLQELGILSQMPDFSESDLGGIGYRKQASAWDDAELRPSKPIISPPSAIQEEGGPRWMVILLVLIGLVVLGIGVTAFFLLSY